MIGNKKDVWKRDQDRLELEEGWKMEKEQLEIEERQLNIEDEQQEMKKIITGRWRRISW